LGENRDTANENENGTEFPLPPSFLFVLFPLPLGIAGGLILFWILTSLPITYNYLRGAPSPIDEYVLALLGSDLSRIVVVFFAVIGVVVGSLLSYFVIKKLNFVKREGEVTLSVRMYMIIFFWWQFAWIPNLTISLVQIILLGIPNSSFLRDIGYAAVSGYSAAAGIPILLKYFFLNQYSSSTNSKLKLVAFRERRGHLKPVHHLVLKLVPSGPDP
jgi:hypothetical protein